MNTTFTVTVESKSEGTPFTTIGSLNTAAEAIAAAKPLALSKRRTHIQYSRFVQTRSFKKGDTAFYINGYGVEEIKIQSWGKEQGTAMKLVSGQYARVRFYTQTTPTFATREEAQSYSDMLAPITRLNHLSGEIDCNQSALSFVKPQYIAEVTARIDKAIVELSTL